jgi:methionine-rich copper-binding protein CopC
LAPLLLLFENNMKPLNYIASFFIVTLLFAGATDVLAQAPSKPQAVAAISFAKGLEFTSYVNAQILHIDFDANISSNYSIELYNLTGAKVGEWKIEKNGDKYCEVILDQPLRKGMYIIKVSAGEKVIAKKLQT